MIFLTCGLFVFVDVAVIFAAYISQNKMKNASLILNVVLVIAVAVLYYLHFSTGKSKSTGGGEEVAAGEQGSILYLNTDSVVTSYNFTKDKQKFIEDNNKQREQLLKSKQASYESAVRNYQSQAAIMTERERASKEEYIMGLQNELLGLQQQFQQDAMLEEQALLSSIVDTLENFMSGYVKEKDQKVDYVLGYQKNGTIFYRNASNDITHDVIEKLNARYKTTTPVPTETGKGK